MPFASTALRVVAVLLASISSSSITFGSESHFVGHWEGTLVREGIPLKVSFDFAEPHGQSKGTFTSVSQKAMDYPLDVFTVDADAVHFVLGGAMVFDGKLNGDKIIGTFTQDSAKGDFILRRTLPEVLPYETVDVSFRNGPVTLSGTLCTPRVPGPHAAVVLLQGSGSETRWGTNRFIADRFARSGIAALVYDKRGSGASTGDWKTSSFDDLANDAIAGIDLLASRSDIDAKRIGLHGHSEGGIIAPMAAVHAPSKVAFVVAEDTVAGLVRDQDVYRVSHQIRQAGFTDAQVEHALDMYKLMIEVLRGAKPYHDLEAASQSVRNETWYQWLGVPPEDSYLRTWYPKVGNLDTLVFWKQVHVPVLLIYGEDDQLVAVDESLAKLEAFLDAVKTPYTAVIVPNAQHNLTVQPEPNAAFFWWKAAPGIVDLVVAWVQQRTTESSR
jgi:alpha-beta hydrolase superfamily lysophospholipase